MTGEPTKPSASAMLRLLADILDGADCTVHDFKATADHDRPTIELGHGFGMKYADYCTSRVVITVGYTTVDGKAAPDGGFVPGALFAKGVAA